MTDTPQLDPAIDAKLRASFGAQSMMQTMGAAIIDTGPGRVVIAAEAAPHLRQQQGYSHAALAFAIADSAAGYAALSVMPPEAEVLSVELKINLLSPGSGRLVAEGRVIKPGRRLVIVAADVWAEEPNQPRRHVAVLQGTMIPV